jgi:hypothetical protein
MTRERYGAVDEPRDPFDETMAGLSGERIMGAVAKGYERVQLASIGKSVRALRNLLAGSSIYFPNGFASTLENNTGLVGRIGWDTGDDGGEEYALHAQWDEAGIIGDIAIDWRLFGGGQIIDERHFGLGPSAPGDTEMPNTMSLGAARRGVNIIRNNVRGATKKAKRLALD